MPKGPRLTIAYLLKLPAAGVLRRAGALRLRRLLVRLDALAAGHTSSDHRRRALAATLRAGAHLALPPRFACAIS
jgi:hypothetical protein